LTFALCPFSPLALGAASILVASGVRARPALATDGGPLIAREKEMPPVIQRHYDLILWLMERVEK
jgi:hypothetical protein